MPGTEQLRTTFAELAGQVQIRFVTGRSRDLIDLLTREGVDVVIPSLQNLGSDFPIPWVGYLYDFQHMYYPEFFDRFDRVVRRHHFSHLISEAPALVVNSRTVRDDIGRFHGVTATPVVAMPFAPYPRPGWLEADVEDAKAHYNVTSPYFMVCNQFWRHKDHATAIRALRELRELQVPGSDRQWQLVCTGLAEDYRDPGYADTTRALIKSMGLSQNVLMLGHVPKLDQIALLRGAVALIQPTLFEGGPGGGAVYDAVAVGTRAKIRIGHPGPP